MSRNFLSSEREKQYAKSHSLFHDKSELTAFCLPFWSRSTGPRRDLFSLRRQKMTDASIPFFPPCVCPKLSFLSDTGNLNCADFPGMPPDLGSSEISDVVLH